jgi:hypothetical protein
MSSSITLAQFLKMPRSEVLALHTQFGFPLLGVFVADGSRRLVLAYSDAEPETEAFYLAAAHLPSQYLRSAVETVFSYGLPILMAPVLGRSLLQRGKDYVRLTLLEGLRLLFNSSEWSEMYQRLGVRVHVYGHPECLQGTACEPALEWIERTQKETAANQQYSLFYAIGETSVVGEEAAQNAAVFFAECQRMPTREEQVRRYYGELLPMADWFIMTSKMSGLGALPPLLINSDTEIYFLPTVMGLTDTVYRQILYDMWFGRSALRQGVNGFELTAAKRAALRRSYDHSVGQVLGVGLEIGRVWVMGNLDSGEKS